MRKFEKMCSFRELLLLCMDNLKRTHRQQQIVDGSIDINTQDNSGKTVLHVFCDWASCSQKYVQTIEFLLYLGANPNVPDNDWKTPWHLTSRLDVGILLMRYGASNKIDKWNRDVFFNKPFAHYQLYRQIRLAIVLLLAKMKRSKSSLKVLPIEIFRSILRMV